MESNKRPSIGASDSDYQEIDVTEISKSFLYDDGSGPWQIIGGSAVETKFDTSQWSQEVSKPENRNVGKYDNAADEPAIHSLDLAKLKVQIDFEYSSFQPQEGEKAVYGTYSATRKALHRWLDYVAKVICSDNQPEINGSYRDHARLNGFHGELERKILKHDLEDNLARFSMFLLLNLEKDHSSNEVQTYLNFDRKELLETLLGNLQFPLPNATGKQTERTCLDETQRTAIVRCLLELSGGRVDFCQHRFAEDSTINDNADICASLFNITRSNQFGDFDAQEICNTLSKSPIFTGTIIRTKDLREWAAKMMDSLFLGFPEGYLGLPQQVLSGFGFGQVDLFNGYLARTYLTFPTLQQNLTNSIPLLLTWSTMLLSSTMDFSRELDVLSKWANSEDGWGLYKKLIRDVQDSQNVEQLTLTITAWAIYRRILPDRLDNTQQPIRGSFVADLDALLHGAALGNSGKVAERMAFALLCELYTSVDQFESLIRFLETVLDRENPPWHIFDGFSIEYLRLRIKGQPHEGAIAAISQIKMPELRQNNDLDDINVMHRKATLPQNPDVHHNLHQPENILQSLETGELVEQFRGNGPPKMGTTTVKASTAIVTVREHTASSSFVAVCSCRDKSHFLSADQYKLIRLSKVQDERILWRLDMEIGTLDEVPNIDKLSDGSWEVCTLISHCGVTQDRLRQILPGSTTDPWYDPQEPTAQDLKIWEYDSAKKLRREWFFQRAIGVIEKGGLAARYYAHHLKCMFGLCSNLPLVPTFRGWLKSMEDAFYLVEACRQGILLYSCRRPRNGEAAFSGGIFVWEPKCTRTEFWSDGIEWNTWTEDGFEVGEATNGSGLMKKTTSISISGTSHHLVSYFTAFDARTLARPSHSGLLNLAPFISSSAMEPGLAPPQKLQELEGSRESRSSSQRRQIVQDGFASEASSQDSARQCQTEIETYQKKTNSEIGQGDKKDVTTEVPSIDTLDPLSVTAQQREVDRGWQQRGKEKIQGSCGQCETYYGFSRYCAHMFCGSGTREEEEDEEDILVITDRLEAVN